tara:strand:- start:1593 stop:2402 length:810 start_codon:yes stop_codon:yes gene_type:complete
MSFDKNLINNPSKGMPRLLEIMRALRDPENGCPWDIEQNFNTIAPYTIEEAYEVADAIERENWDDLKNELGDLLLQTVYHTQMAEEEDRFNFNDVVNQISEKMIQRHPHVFGNENRNKTASQQVKDWESIKAEERLKKNQAGILDDVALNLPALVRSLKLQKRAARVGFDWPNISQVLDKIDEETKELIEAKKTEPQERISEEFGDLMFSIVNLGRHLKVDPEEALKQTNRKFINRFKFVEESIRSQGKKIEDTSLEEMEGLWQQAKDL